jgi:hypothetical protein
MALHFNTETGTTREGADYGVMHVYNNTGGDLSEGDVRQIVPVTGAWELAAISTTTGDEQRICVLKEDIADGDYGEVYIWGSAITATLTSATYTATHGLVADTSDADIVSTGSAFTGLPQEFAVIHTTVTGTSVVIDLIDKMSLVRA